MNVVGQRAGAERLDLEETLMPIKVVVEFQAETRCESRSQESACEHFSDPRVEGARLPW